MGITLSDSLGACLWKTHATAVAAVLCLASTHSIALAQADAGRGAGAGTQVPTESPEEVMPSSPDMSPETPRDAGTAPVAPVQPDMRTEPGRAGQPSMRMDEYAERPPMNEMWDNFNERDRPPLEWKNDLAERHTEV